jgi:hypothetical protein
MNLIYDSIENKFIIKSFSKVSDVVIASSVDNSKPKILPLYTRCIYNGTLEIGLVKVFSTVKLIMSYTQRKTVFNSHKVIYLKEFV